MGEEGAETLSPESSSSPDRGPRGHSSSAGGPACSSQLVQGHLRPGMPPRAPEKKGKGASGPSSGERMRSGVGAAKAALKGCDNSAHEQSWKARAA